MDLLTSGDRAEVKAAVYDLHDTFDKTTVRYGLAGTTFDRFNEDTLSKTQYVWHNVLARVEYGQQIQDKFEYSVDGPDRDFRIKITFTTQYLEAQGLWDSVNNKAKFDGTRDTLFITDQEYRITEDTVYEGFFESKPLLTILYVEPKNKKTA